LKSDQRASARTVALLIAAALACAALIDPHSQPGFTICTLKQFTGIACPGCGLTHAFAFLMHGDLAAAIQANALSPLVFGAVLFTLGRCLLTLAGRCERPWPRLPHGVYLAAAAVALGWWALRLSWGV